MAMWKIENTLSGVVLGIYEGATTDSALDACAADAGYESYAALEAESPSKPGEIKVTEMTTYCYSIYDADPRETGLDEWPCHAGASVAAADVVGAVALAREALSQVACSLYRKDGWQVGQKIYAQVQDKNGSTVGIVSYELADSDLR